MTRKAQVSESISIAVLVAGLMFFLVLSSGEMADFLSHRSSRLIEESGSGLLSKSAATVPYITDTSIPISELIGVYSCYETTEANYGQERVRVFDALQSFFDGVYGRNSWYMKVVIKERTSKKSESFFIIDASGSMIFPSTETDLSNFETIRQAAKQINPDAVIVRSTLLADKAACTIPNERPFRTDNDLPDPTENWPGWVTYVSEHSPLDENGNQIQWPEGFARNIFVSSDELACSAGPTSKYVDEAVKAANKNNVHVFFIKPQNVYPGTGTPGAEVQPEDLKEYLDGITMLTSETGGQVIELSDVDSVAHSLQEILTAEITKSVYLDSEGVSDAKNQDADYYAATLLFPQPCRVTGFAEATLYAKK